MEPVRDRSLFFRRLVESALDLTVVLDAAGRMQYVSPSFEEVLGYAPDALIGTSALALVHPEDLPLVEAWLDRVREQPGASDRVGCRVRTTGGTWRHLEAVARNLLDDPGVAGLLVNARDITERVRAQHELHGIREHLQDRVDLQTAELREGNARLRGEIEKHRAVREELDGFFTLSVDLLCILGQDGRFKRTNPAAERILGYPAAELLQTSLLDLVHPGDREAVAAEFERGREGGAVAQFTGRFRCRDGSYRWLSWSVVPPQGGLHYAVARDITERKQEETEIQERERLFRLLFLNNPLPMWVFDEETLFFLEVNAAAVAHYGYTRDEFLRMRITDLRPPEDIPALQRYLQSDRPALRPSTRWRHVRRDGTILHVEISSHSLFYHDRKAVLVVVQDVTERVQAEAERDRLLAQEQAAREVATQARQRLEFLFRTMNAMLADWLDYATSLRRLAEAVVPTLADWCIIDLLGEDSRPERLAVVHRDPSRVELARALERHAPGGTATESALQRVLRTGEAALYPEIPEEVLAAAAQDEAHLRLLQALDLRSALIVPLVARNRVLGTLTLCTAESGRRYGEEDRELVEDLAQRAAMLIDNARLYRDVQRANAELERRVRERTLQLEAANQELESFSYSVSHDLRSPLRAIDGFSRILVESHADSLNEKAQDYLQRVRKNALRMGALIDDLLQFSRLSRKELQKQMVQPAAVVQQALEELAPLQEGRSVEITLHELPPCEADPALLRQVYVNLLSNALKFTSYRDAARIDVGARTLNGRTVYYVADNGAGFDMQYAPKLFGVFQRLHRQEEYEGTGVGLAIVQRIIHRHGGEVWATAEAGKGATFFFTLEARTDERRAD